MLAGRAASLAVDDARSGCRFSSLSSAVLGPISGLVERDRIVAQVHHCLERQVRTGGPAERVQGSKAEGDDQGGKS